ncbi:unnamed protein product [Plutella xylostella]|uniref:(diamondback moth) hypothetical protein n=1 Tax=Plutella xylostella TaxID=51655 RepID=A0A8S4G393_PLUXY|nr:unnamed protein product [Plutella xylostella]
MANQNIEEWSVDQVADWLTGLGAPAAGYAAGLRARGLHGRKLLTLRCDDLEYLGVTVIGHQELILEAVEQLRDYSALVANSLTLNEPINTATYHLQQYELSRECVARLALRARVAAAALRSLCPSERRLHTQALADVARTVSAVKPLVCWLDRWSLFGGSGLAERRALLLKLSLEAATSAQRDRFAEQPARAVAAAAAAIASTADYIIQDVQDHMVLVPARVDSVTLQQGARPLGFRLAPPPAGRHLADIRFGSPAHRHPHIHDGDEILQVGDRVVVGWGGDAVMAECMRAAAAAPRGELTLSLRRRGARGAGAALATPTGRQARDWPRHMRRFPPPWEYNDLRSFK